MKANRAQMIMLFGLWNQAKNILMGGRETWTGAEEDDKRHEFTEKTLGTRKSWKDLNNRGDVDLLKAGLLAIIQPGNLDAQLKQIRQPHKRAMYRLKELMGELRVDWNYVAGIVHTMSQGTIDKKTGQPLPPKISSGDIDNLDAAELRKVVIALEQHARRKSNGKRVYHLHAA